MLTTAHGSVLMLTSKVAHPFILALPVQINSKAHGEPEYTYV